jgi:hypothetical protein
MILTLQPPQPLQQAAGHFNFSQPPLTSPAFGWQAQPLQQAAGHFNPFNNLVISPQSPIFALET